ncbi:MAG: hypothetical protein V7L01_09470 [Nostoc sp.]
MSTPQEKLYVFLFGSPLATGKKRCQIIPNNPENMMLYLAEKILRQSMV